MVERQELYRAPGLRVLNTIQTNGTHLQLRVRMATSQDERMPGGERFYQNGGRKAVGAA